MLKLLYFAALVDRLGIASEQIERPDGVDDVRSLTAWLHRRGGAWEEIFGRSSLRITVNKQFSDLATPLRDGDEVAFISASL